jgi:sec-independent protein translocase protein TatA
LAKLFDNPLPLILIVVLALMLFGAPKLPGMARSIGQSLRIFKSEVHQLKDDVNPDADADSNAADSNSFGGGREARQAGSADVETAGTPRAGL